MNHLLEWSENGQIRRARWRSEAGLPLPQALDVVDDSLSADAAFAALAAGTALLWRGDWMNARQLMQALTRRADRHFAVKAGSPAIPAETFARHRQRQGQRAALLARLLVPLGPDYKLPLRRAQDVRPACREAWGKPDGGNSVVALRELLAVISAYEWRKKGVPVAAVGGSIHPHYGVFSPVRGEYVDLVAQAPLPPGCERAFDIGTGSGVLAAVLARRGLTVIATDTAPRALACAAENAEKLGLAEKISLVETDLFPEGCAPLVVCNPPWLPAEPSSPIEYAIYDPDSRMLRGFLGGLREHLAPGGEGWLIISDIAEHLGLRSRQQLLDWITGAGLQVLGRLDTRPQHGKVADRSDPLHAARAAEVTSLWRLGVAD
ncbi:MAG: methyltransferase [Betaproteobacteria bacterium HGW-Betaproteobacteria-7]|jgi:SAM-dependent methyltransferase|nr:MAG: methyltransferase [Betaproteobacteria bacterium HGW-Betaproteobacteria-7]